MNNQKKTVLSKTEYGIYVDFAQNPQSTAYNLPLFVTFDKSFDAFKLKEAVEKAIENHPYLKSRLSLDENGNVCKCIFNEPAAVEVKEMRSADFDKNAFVKPFDLLRDRLYKCCVIKTESAVILFCDFHHIITDGLLFVFFWRISTAL